MDKPLGKARSKSSSEPPSNGNLPQNHHSPLPTEREKAFPVDSKDSEAIESGAPQPNGTVNDKVDSSGESIGSVGQQSGESLTQKSNGRATNDQEPRELGGELGGELKGEVRIPTRTPKISSSEPALARSRPRPAATPQSRPQSKEAGEAPVSIKFLLFINLRNHSSALVKEIRSTLTDLQNNEQFELEITQVREHPELAEHFKLVATPSLVKTHPLPAQVLTGSNVTEQLRYWWPRWISEAKLLRSNAAKTDDPALDLKGLPTDISEYIFGLEDEAFRLRKEKESLQAQLRFRDRIISILAHDLRNPLMGASLAIETLGKGLSNETPLPDGLDLQLVRQAKGQLKVLDNLVADMLQPDWGQERLTIEPQRCDLGELRATVIQQFEEQIAAKNQKLEVDIPLDLPPACVDKERIRQVFANLLDNASKYTPRGGEIIISAFHRTSQKLEVSVCDTGPGIPEEEQGRIFENTVRLARDQGTPGYGIGLALCDRIIKAHFCRIWVDSRMPEGSCFRFTLPVFDE